MPTTTRRRSPSVSSSPTCIDTTGPGSHSMVRCHPAAQRPPGARRPGRVIAALALALVWNGPLVAQSQTPGAAPPQAPPGLTPSFRAERSSDAFTLTYFNRPIVVLRARVLGRGPVERSAGPGASSTTWSSDRPRDPSMAADRRRRADSCRLPRRVRRGPAGRRRSGRRDARRRHRADRRESAAGACRSRGSRTPGVLLRAAALSASRSPSPSLHCGASPGSGGL